MTATERCRSSPLRERFRDHLVKAAEPALVRGSSSRHVEDEINAGRATTASCPHLELLAYALARRMAQMLTVYRDGKASLATRSQLLRQDIIDAARIRSQPFLWDTALAL